MTYILIQLLLAAVTFAFWNGYVILWGRYKNMPIENDYRKRYSKIWHLLGWIVRFQLAIIMAHMIYLNKGFDWLYILKWELLFLAIANIGYDLVINIVRYSEVGYPHLLYVDNKGINKFLLSIFKTEVWFWIGKLVFIVGTIILIIL